MRSQSSSHTLQQDCKRELITNEKTYATVSCKIRTLEISRDARRTPSMPKFHFQLVREEDRRLTLWLRRWYWRKRAFVVVEVSGCRETRCSAASKLTNRHDAELHQFYVIHDEFQSANCNRKAISPSSHMVLHITLSRHFS